MITENRIKELAEEYLKDTDQFLLEVKIRKGNRILVTIDGDRGVSIDDCVGLSRHIEGHLDRDEEDFELEVSTGGADQPLRTYRQYPKHVGRKLKINMKDGTVITGELMSVNPEFLEIKQQGDKAAKVKPGTDQANLKLDFTNIDFTTIILSYR